MNAKEKMAQHFRVWGAHAAATWFESLAVASRPLQRRFGETNLNPSWSAKHASELRLSLNSLESASDVVDRHACGKVWG
jgi:hypothetical protein